MAVIKKCGQTLKKLVQKIMFRIKLWQMDDLWYYIGGYSWELFPPSFYYTHTEEEIKTIKAEIRARIQKVTDESE